jgi:hypothetical protein
MLAAKPRRASATRVFQQIASDAAAAPNKWRRFDLRSALVTTALGTGVLAAAGLWPANDAMAGCVDYDPTGTPNTVFCDAAQTTTNSAIESVNVLTDQPHRGYIFDQLIPNTDDVEVTITTDGVIDGFGLAVQTFAPGAAITVDHQGAISVDDGNIPAFGGPAVFNLTTDGGDITYTGNGSVIDNDGGNFGLVHGHRPRRRRQHQYRLGRAFPRNADLSRLHRTPVDSSGTGSQNIFLDGGTLVVTDPFGVGALATSTTGDINMVLTGNTSITTTIAPVSLTGGVVGNSAGGDVTIESDANIGSAGFEFATGIASNGSNGTAIDITQTGGTILATFARHSCRHERSEYRHFGND